MNRCSLFLCFMLLFFGAGRPAETQENAASHPPDRSLCQAIDAALDRPELRVGFQGVLIQSLQEGTVLYERNADRAFLPASNQKLLTSGAALALLGPNFTYHTSLYRSGKVSRSGVLHGDLILRGDGDPLLAPDDLHNMTQNLRRAGIRRVAGYIRYDDSRFDTEPLGAGWTWDDEPDDYSAQISALNVHANVLDFEIRPGSRVGAPVKLKILPLATYAAVLNQARTGPPHSKQTLKYERLRGRNGITISGNLAVDSAAKPILKVTIEEPARFTAAIFAAYLKQAGIKRKPKIMRRKWDSTRAVLIADHVSPPLTAILARMNKPSDNLIAECLLKTIGAVRKAEGSGRKGREAATEWLTTIGLNAEQLHLADGSGLSRYNAVSPRNLVRLLAYLYKSSDRAAFFASLPVAGIDGTLKGRMQNTTAQGNAHAKTGTMAHVCSLSGYVTDRDGETLLYSLLMNNHLSTPAACRAAQDKIVVLLADYHRPLPADSSPSPGP